MGRIGAGRRGMIGVGYGNRPADGHDRPGVGGGRAADGLPVKRVLDTDEDGTWFLVRPEDRLKEIGYRYRWDGTFRLTVHGELGMSADGR